MQSFINQQQCLEINSIKIWIHELHTHRQLRSQQPSSLEAADPSGRWVSSINCNHTSSAFSEHCEVLLEQLSLKEPCWRRATAACRPRWTPCVLLLLAVCDGHCTEMVMIGVFWQLLTGIRSQCKHPVCFNSKPFHRHLAQSRGL